MKTVENKVTFDIPSSTDQIAKVIHSLEDFLASQDCCSEAVCEVTLAVSEAVTNAIVHGNKKNARRHVFLTFSIIGSKLRILIEDQGTGFDEKQIPNPMALQNRMKPSGRGIYLMQALMDKVVFKRKGKGMQVEMIKQI
ncbi:ATP-binding protein [candidate division KSB1 bacterium]|nr:ATP-binding protein [candidate division KSB1 bacterium]